MLVKDDRDQYGEEAIATLLKLMEDRRDDLVVIMAGYQKEMNAMLQVNPVERLFALIEVKDDQSSKTRYV